MENIRNKLKNYTIRNKNKKDVSGAGKRGFVKYDLVSLFQLKLLQLISEWTMIGFDHLHVLYIVYLSYRVTFTGNSPKSLCVFQKHKMKRKNNFPVNPLTQQETTRSTQPSAFTKEVGIN